MEMIQVELHAQLTGTESILQFQVLLALQIVREVGGTVLKPNFHLQALGFGVTGLHKEHQENIQGLFLGCLVVEFVIFCQNVLRL
jgi:hypothetical protein